MLLGVLYLPQTIIAAFRNIPKEAFNLLSHIAIQSIFCCRPGSQIWIAVDGDKYLVVADYCRTDAARDTAPIHMRVNPFEPFSVRGLWVFNCLALFDCAGLRFGDTVGRSDTAKAQDRENDKCSGY